MFQIKANSQKKDFNKTEISNLPYEEFKAMILKKKKKNHLFREKNEWAQSELQQRDIKYKKVPKESHNWTENKYTRVVQK